MTPDQPPLPLLPQPSALPHGRATLLHPGVETASAGLAPDAEEECSAELVEWADIIFVMERAHRSRLQRRFKPQLRSARVVCLDIPDDYAFMQPELVDLLTRKVRPFLP